MADHFPIRPQLIGWLNRPRMLVGVSGSKRVIIGRDGWLFFDDDTHLGAARGDPPMSSPELRQWLTTLAGRTESLKARGITYLVVATPVKETIYPQFGPHWYHGPNPDRPAMRLPRLAQSSGAGDILYLYPAVAEATRRGQTTYSRHDTHWNGYGGYAGYAAIMNHLHALGLTEGPRPLSDFILLDAAPAVAPRDLALMLGVASFVPVKFPHIDSPDSAAKLSIQYLTAKADWTSPQVIETGEAGKPVLLMTRDSFSNEILPFLYPHFSRIVLAHNQDGAWRPDLIDRFKPDLVILELIEPGLRVGMGDGPGAVRRPPRRGSTRCWAPPTAAAGARSPVDIPTLVQPDAASTAVIVGAKVTGNCNVEVATLTAGEAGDATFTGSGWFSELGNQVTSPKGLIALRGPWATWSRRSAMDKAAPGRRGLFQEPRRCPERLRGDLLRPQPAARRLYAHGLSAGGRRLDRLRGAQQATAP